MLLVKQKGHGAPSFSYLSAEASNRNHSLTNFNNMISYAFSGAYVSPWSNRGETFSSILLTFFGDWSPHRIVWDEPVFATPASCFKGDNKCVLNYTHCEWTCKCHPLILTKLVFNTPAYLYSAFTCCMIVISEIFYRLACKFDPFGKLDTDPYYQNTR